MIIYLFLNSLSSGKTAYEKIKSCRDRVHRRVHGSHTHEYENRRDFNCDIIILLDIYLEGGRVISSPLQPPQFLNTPLTVAGAIETRKILVRLIYVDNRRGPKKRRTGRMVIPGEIKGGLTRFLSVVSGNNRTAQYNI